MRANTDLMTRALVSVPDGVQMTGSFMSEPDLCGNDLVIDVGTDNRGTANQRVEIS
jgi:hypothetical protein